MKVFLTLILMFFVSTGVFAQSSASDTFVGRVKVWEAVTLDCIADIAFPDIVANVAYGAGTIASNAVTPLVPGGALGHNLSCTVSGQPSAKYTVTPPAGNVSFLIETDLVIDAFGFAGGGNHNRTLDVNGDDTFALFARMREVTANAVSAAGDYETASLSVSIAYNNW